VFKLFLYPLCCIASLFWSLVPSFAQNVDPTKPLSAHGVSSTNKVKKVNELVLETIVYGDNIRTAIINGKLLKVGDTIGGHEVLVVNDKSVTLGRDQERLKLTIFSDVVVKTR